MPLFKKAPFLETSTLIFYLLIWIVNPTNKLMLVLGFIFLLILTVKLKSLGIGSLIMFILTSTFPMGKKYIIVLHDLKKFPLLHEIYPIGLTTTITLSVSDVFFSLFFIAVLVNLIKNGFKQLRVAKITYLDFFIISFLVYGIFADLISSKRPFLSILFKKELFESIYIYFVLRYNIIKFPRLSSLIVALLFVMLFFESFLALQQFIISAPVGKNFEAFFNQELFGAAVDELNFTFRPLGTFNHANYLGLFIAILLPIQLYLIIFKKKYSPVVNMSFLLGLATLFLSLSRSAWIGFFIGIMYFIFIIERRFNINLLKRFTFKRIILFILFLLPLTIFILPRISKSVYSLESSGGLTLRIKQVSESLGLLEDSPLTGVGTGMSVLEMVNKNNQNVFIGFPSPIHNHYALLAVENGFPSLVLLLIIIILALKNNSALNKPYFFASISSTLVILIFALFQPVFDYRMFFILLGLNFAKISHVN